jgi:drug/metabolite transporter (DMT)-like permease
MYLAAAFLFAFNGTVSKAAMNAGLDPVHLTEIRNAGSMLVLLGVLLASRPAALRVRRGEIGFLAAYGVVAFAIVQFLYFLTISRLPVGIGTLLAFLAPVVVAVWLRFGRGQAVRRRVWAALALSVAGLALVAEVWRGVALDGLGVLAGLATAVTLSLYWLLGEAGQRTRDAVSLTFWGFFFATLTWSVIAPWWAFPWSTLGVQAQSVAGGPGLPVWALVTWTVLLGTIAPFLLVLGSLRRIGSQRAGIVGTTEPVWATLIALALLGETDTAVQAVGGLVVLGAVVLAETARGR